MKFIGLLVCSIAQRTPVFSVGENAPGLPGISEQLIKNSALL
jgi:hypothetical protein